MANGGGLCRRTQGEDRDFGQALWGATHMDLRQLMRQDEAVIEYVPVTAPPTKRSEQSFFLLSFWGFMGFSRTVLFWGLLGGDRQMVAGSKVSAKVAHSDAGCGQSSW